MYNYHNYRFSRGDGALLVDKGTGRVDEMLWGSLEAGPVSFVGLPFAPLGTPLPRRVALSVLSRHTAIWGRY